MNQTIKLNLSEFSALVESFFEISKYTEKPDFKKSYIKIKKVHNRPLEWDIYLPPDK